MAIQLASKYSPKVSERFKLTSKTDAYCGHDYEFTGVNEISIYSIDTVQTTTYTRSGPNRFGTATELGDTVQTLTMEVDKAFTFTIDSGNAAEQFNIKHANKCLKRQWDEVCTPEIDIYRINSWINGKGLSPNNSVTTVNQGALTRTTIVEKIFEASAQMSDDLVPLTGRTIFIPELTYVHFKLANEVMGADKLNAEAIRRGLKGTIDGMNVVTVPMKYFPSNGSGGSDYNFIIKYKHATVDPMKLKNLRVHKNPPGIDGDLVEGRYMYDSFVLDNMAKGIFVSKNK